MRISDQVALAAKNLSRRKGRTALTVIGVVVGTCAVIVMISLGIAQNKAYDEMLSTWGDTPDSAFSAARPMRRYSSKATTGTGVFG